MYRSLLHVLLHKGVASLFALMLFLACTESRAPVYRAVVTAGYAGQPGAVIDGRQNFASIGEALEAVPAANSSPFAIFVHNGRYSEKLSVDKAHVRLIGESRDATVITFSASAATPGPDGEPCGTRGCSTLRVAAPDFRAENLTIENGFDYPANLAKSDDDPSKVQNPQAVAVMLTGESDRAVFRNCKIAGYQDTLFPDTGRSCFDRCRILGHVDFIFGAGQAVFQECEIVSRNRRDKNPTGYITAPSTPINCPYGFLFDGCNLVKEDSTLPAASVRLGRPWHPQADPRISGSAVFIRCDMDDHIGPIGYAKISSTDSIGQRIWFDLEPDSRFFEYGSHGPGALVSPQRPTLDEKAAAWYNAAHVLNGWIP